MIAFFSYEFTTSQFIVFCVVALLIGMSKTGVHGAGMAAVPLLAMVFGGQLSSGVLLPIICLADVLGVFYYHRHASWKHLKKLFPTAAAGTILGTVVGGAINDNVFKMIMAIVIIASVMLMLWLKREENKNEIPDNRWFAAFVGLLAGFVSMVGNLAGPMMAVYFLSMRLPKNSFIGTSAWFFMVINWFKIPFHVFAWHTINMDTFLLDLTTLPIILLGAFIGILIVRNLSESSYRWFIIATTILAALLMIFK